MSLGWEESISLPYANAPYAVLRLTRAAFPSLLFSSQFQNWNTFECLGLLRIGVQNLV